MSTTVVIQIGNSDDKLTQEQWAEFVGYLHGHVRKAFSTLHFFGGSVSNSPYQNWCAVGEIEENLWRGNDWDSLDEWLDNVIRPELSNLAKRFNQDSIAMTIGGTEFVEARGGAA